MGGKNKLNFQYSNLRNLNRATTSEETNGFKITSTGVSGYGFVSFPIPNSLLGKEITISMNSSGNKTPSGRLFYSNSSGTLLTNIGAFWTTNNSKTVTLPSELTGNQAGIDLVLYISQGNNSSGDYATFTNIQIEEGSIATPYSPYVSNPIELCKIGNYVDKLKRAEGKNYCYTNASEWELGQYGVNGEKAEFSQRARISTLIPVQPNTTIYVHTNNTNYSFVLRGYGQNNEIITSYGQVINGNTITTTNVYYLGVTIMHTSDISTTAGQTILNNIGETIFPMICLNSETNKSYEPYGVGTWYIEKNIGKVVLNGTENWANDGGTVGTNYRHNIQVSALGIATPLGTTGNALTDHFKSVTVGNNNQAWGNFYLSSTWLVIHDKDAVYNSKANFVNWLTTNNTELYYVLANPTYEIITNENLIQQLNNIQDIELIENLCYVDWVGEEKPTMTLQYPTNETLNAYITTEDNKLIRTDWGV